MSWSIVAAGLRRGFLQPGSSGTWHAFWRGDRPRVVAMGANGEIAIARRSGHPKLALLDFGCSAGLNLGVDAYRYDDGAGDASAPRVACGPKAAPVRPPLRRTPSSTAS